MKPMKDRIDGIGINGVMSGLYLPEKGSGLGYAPIQTIECFGQVYG